MWLKVESLGKLFLLGHEGSLKNQRDLLISNLCKETYYCINHRGKKYRSGKVTGEEMSSALSMLSWAASKIAK